jgi:hypothetical protein
LADQQHGLDGAAARVGDGAVDAVDLGKTIELHQAVEGEPLRLVELDQFRNELLGHRVAFNDAEDLAVPLRPSCITSSISTFLANRLANIPLAITFSRKTEQNRSPLKTLSSNQNSSTTCFLVRLPLHPAFIIEAQEHKSQATG